MNLRKSLRWTLIAAGAIVVAPLLLLALAVLVLESEWAERRIERFASERLERTVRLDEIDLRFAWPPRIHLDQLRIANPEWAHTKHLLDAEGLAASIQVLPLFTGQVVIDKLSVTRGRAGLEQDGKRATWRFGPRQDEPSRFHLQEVHVEDGWIYYGNAPRKTALHVHARGELGTQGGNIAIAATGTFRGAPAEAAAKAPSLLLSADRPIRLSFEASVGRTSGSGEGTFQASTAGIGIIDGDLQVRGQTLEHLFDLFGVNAPATPPYRLEGHLRHTQKVWTFEPFSGEVGDSDLRGSWSYDTSGEKPMLRANLTSKLLDFNDLGPIIGAPPATGPGETASPAQKRQAQALARKSDLLPDAKFETGRWDEMNAECRRASDGAACGRAPGIADKEAFHSPHAEGRGAEAAAACVRGGGGEKSRPTS